MSGRKVGNHERYKILDYSSLIYPDKDSEQLDQSALGEISEEIGREVDNDSDNRDLKDDKGPIHDVIKWIEQIKLVILAFGIF